MSACYGLARGGASAVHKVKPGSIDSKTSGFQDVASRERADSEDTILLSESDSEAEDEVGLGPAEERGKEKPEAAGPGLCVDGVDLLALEAGEAIAASPKPLGAPVAAQNPEVAAAPADKESENDTPDAASTCSADSESKQKKGGGVSTFAGDSGMVAILNQGIRIFNLNPMRGIEFIQKAGLVHRIKGDDDGNARRVAIFLRHTRGLNKEQVGKVLGSERTEHVAILSNYFLLFDFSEFGPTIQGLEEALRVVFDCFKPPGESQKIERILEIFASRFNEDNNLVGDGVEGAGFHESTTMLLSYSIIILNVDLHNPNNPRKMTRREFVRNFRGLDNGRDLPEIELQRLYDRISRSEIRHKVDRDELAGNLFTQPDKSGWLYKKGPSVFSKWRPRWFILSENTLYYFKHSEAVEFLGFIPLENVLVRTCFDVKNQRRERLLSQRNAHLPRSHTHTGTSTAAHRHASSGLLAAALASEAQPGSPVIAHTLGIHPHAAGHVAGAHASMPAMLRVASGGNMSAGSCSSADEMAAACSGSAKQLHRKASNLLAKLPHTRSELLLRAGAVASSELDATRSARKRDFWFELYPWDARLNVKSARMTSRGAIKLGQHRTIKLRADSRQELENWVELVNQKGRFNIQSLAGQAGRSPPFASIPGSPMSVSSRSTASSRQGSRTSGFFRCSLLRSSTNSLQDLADPLSSPGSCETLASGADAAASQSSSTRAPRPRLPPKAPLRSQSEVADAGAGA